MKKNLKFRSTADKKPVLPSVTQVVVRALGAAILLPVFCVICLPGTAIGSPYIKAGASEFNLGQVSFGTVVQHTFWIHATENDTLVLDTIIPGCGCMVVPKMEKIVAPGDSLAYEITLKTESLRGSVVKSPAFKVRGDTATHRFKLYAQIMIKQEEFFPLLIRPYVLDYSSYSETHALGPQEMEFTLTNLSEEDIILRVAGLASEIMDIEFPDKLKAGETFEGLAKIKKEYHKKELATSVTLEVNESEMYRMTIPIWRRISRHLWYQLDLPEDSK